MFHAKLAKEQRRKDYQHNHYQLLMTNLVIIYFPTKPQRPQSGAAIFSQGHQRW